MKGKEEWKGKEKNQVKRVESNKKTVEKVSEQELTGKEKWKEEGRRRRMEMQKRIAERQREKS